MLRKSKPSGDGVDLASLTTAADSLTGEDTVYSTVGWLAARMPFITGTPDVDHNTDSTPDTWVMAVDGTLYFYGETTRTTVVSSSPLYFSTGLDLPRKTSKAASPEHGTALGLSWDFRSHQLARR